MGWCAARRRGDGGACGAAVRRAESEGAPRGEGVQLSELYGEKDGTFSAVSALTALYLAFFKRGDPRTLVPDYASRSAAAGKTVLPPTEEEYERRKAALSTHRGDLLREISSLSAGSARERRFYTQLAGHVPAKPSLAELYALPDRAAEGLSAVIRDFGLLERT